MDSQMSAPVGDVDGEDVGNNRAMYYCVEDL